MAKSRDPPSPKIGAGHAQGMFRLGLKEAASFLAPDSPHVQPPETGIFGSPSQGEIAEARRETVLDSNEEPRSILQDRLKEIEESRGVHGREEIELERD